MRAAAFARTGGVEVLEMMDLPVPQLEVDEVLVRVKACALNHLDLWVRKGLPTPIPMPHIGGCEVAGEVAELGSKVSQWQVGQRVLISPGQSCLQCEWCSQGMENCCDRYRVLGYHLQGGFAEFAKARAVDLFAISESWAFSEWAATPLTFLTAWNMLHKRACVLPNETVVVWGASSGVGTAATQVAKSAGAIVIAVAGSEEKLRKAAQLGADYLLDRTKVDVAHEVRGLTRGRGADIVIEHVGAAVWHEALRCLGVNGRLVTCGATTGAKVDIDLRFIFTQQHAIMGNYMGSRHDLMQCLLLLERKVLHPVVDSVFPLENLREAHERMERGEMFGKIVIAP